jgi:hypothetical protein
MYFLIMLRANYSKVIFTISITRSLTTVSHKLNSHPHHENTHINIYASIFSSKKLKLTKI